MGAHIALRPGPPMGFLGWVLPQMIQPMGAHSAVYLRVDYKYNYKKNKGKE
jgi:hypothetical protein